MPVRGLCTWITLSLWTKTRPLGDEKQTCQLVQQFFQVDAAGACSLGGDHHSVVEEFSWSAYHHYIDVYSCALECPKP